MKLAHRILSVAVLAALSAPASAEIVIDVIADNEVSLEGLVQADGNWFDNDVVDLNDDSVDGNGGNGKDSEFELRRAEIVLKGKATNYNWVLGYDAKADKWLDVNLAWKLGGNSTIQFGQYKQPNSMEELSSTKNNDFIAKSVTTNTFGVARRLGGAFNTGGDNWGLTASAFGRELTRNLAHGSGYGARFYFAPINESGNILHLGISAVDYDTDADTVRVRARPDADLATERLVDTGDLTNTDRQTTFGLEGLWVTGPFKLQAEYMQSTIDRYETGFEPSDEFKGDSWYITGVWNITGETWGYKGGVPTTPLPDEPASGLWQVGLRYDAIDLDDGEVLGGDMNTITAGVNWYWRSNFKFMLNYVMVSSTRFDDDLLADVDDDPNILEARLQFYW